MTVLEKGDKAPEFVLKNQNDEEVKLIDYAGKKVLVYFYPKAMTPGCINQACALRDNKSEYDGLGVDIIGISPDSPAKQKKFEEKKELNFTLLCDEDHAVAEAFGIWQLKKFMGKEYMGVVRSAFLIDENGAILEAWGKISPKDTVPKTLKALGVEL